MILHQFDLTNLLLSCEVEHSVFAGLCSLIPPSSEFHFWIQQWKNFQNWLCSKYLWTFVWIKRGCMYVYVCI